MDSILDGDPVGLAMMEGSPGLGAPHPSPSETHTHAPPSAEVMDVAMLEQALMSTDTTRRTVAQMLSMLRAAVPAVSLSMESIDAAGVSNRPSIVFRGVQLRVSPKQLRHEYLTRYDREDPFHARHMVDSRDIIRGTHERPDLLKNPGSNLFMEYATECDMPHFVRLFLRYDSHLVGYLFLARRHGQRPFSERELAFLTHAHPFLESAYIAVTRPAPKVENEGILLRSGLTQREIQVARYAATGMKAHEIAEILVLTEATVKTHLARIYPKLGVRSKAELAARLRPSEL